MLIYDDSPGAPVTRRTGPTPETHQPSPSGEPRPLTLTCIEARPELEILRAGVYQEFAPSNTFRQILADDIAEEIWMKKRFSDVANQSLSFEIEKAFDQVSQAYPDVDPSLRTVLAWKEFHKDPACRASLAERTRGTRNLLALSRHLSAAGRRK